MPSRYPRLAVAAACLLTTLFVGACQVLPTRCGDDDGCPPPHGVKVAKDPTVMNLAHDLDHLEKHIEWYGSVVPKVPDVWGQARLTQHREEFEAEMKKELGAFEFRLNGALSRADSAFFAQTTALGAAAQSRPVGLLGGTRPRGNGLSETVVQPLVLAPSASVVPAGTTTAVQGQTTTTTDKDGNTTSVTIAPPGVVAAAPTAGLDLTTAAVRPGRLPNTAIGIEPTLLLQQKARYLDLLNQIRRTNEGDDTADAPGYSLNLVRIPVSILPGKKTDVGYGAEVTFTLNPVLSDELLPTTFRMLAVNDVADHLSFPLVRYLEDAEAASLLTYDNRKAIGLNPDGLLLPMTAPVTATRKGRYAPAAMTSDRPVRFDQIAKARFKVPSVAPAKGTQARAGFPNSALIDVYGPEFCFEIAYQANQAFKETIDLHGYAHMPDVQSFLLSELNAAQRYLAEPGSQGLWVAYCTPDLVTAVRDRDYAGLARRRQQFRAHFEQSSSSTPSLPPRPQSLSITSALAWCLLVDSALLTDRLVQDMRETAAAKGCAGFCGSGGWLDFYAPCPSPEARHAFNEYVRCRWPVRVFALDPATQDQNLADELSTRRETQLALSLAFVNGRISASSLTQYARRLEATYETIALNRTQVGFSHGENTFGWRFAPRFQTPDTESNLTVLFRDQLIGGPSRDALLRQRRLEPGPRECVAVVLMPSFVPTMTCDSVSNWFDLTNPKHKKFDHAEAMKASRAVKALQVHGPKVGDAACYRDGDFPRLLRRVEQLEARLPTQTSTIPVPVINTLGGFKMFNNGTTDFAPELYGFYGAPGARTDSPTTLFLVGEHFSPLHTKVIVGNQECDKEMLSRQVMKVTVKPVGVPTKDSFLHAHVATPYGVSREIEIPVAAPAGALDAQLTVSPGAWSLAYRVEDFQDDAGKQAFRYKLLDGRPPAATYTWVGALGDRPNAIDVKLALTGAAAADASVTVPFNGVGYVVPVTVLLSALVDKINATAAPTGFDARIGEDGAAAAAVKVTADSKDYKVYGGPVLYLNRATPRPSVIPRPPVKMPPAKGDGT